MPEREEKLLYQIALTQIDGVGDITARNLLTILGNEKAVFDTSREELIARTHISHKQADAVLSPEVFVRAEKEKEFVTKNNIQTYFINEQNYPRRLRECIDAPVLLYYKGKADLNAQKIVSIVGTRNSTSYGDNFCDRFLHELAEMYPDVLIVSGLAYGIDACAHRAALRYDLPTVGVLAHGLDRIYPSKHRQLALEMVSGGGLLTEFGSGTNPDRHNFVRRNRIVAGMADAVIVVESPEKGGSLITAELANSYCKDVFALPGRASDAKSLGCNKLIAEHKADLLLSVNYFLEQMSWDADSQNMKKQPRQQELFVSLTDEEQAVVNSLSDGELHIDQLSIRLCLPVYELLPLLLEMELKGIVQNRPGNIVILA